MKQFRKKHTKLPRPGAVARLIHRTGGPTLLRRYQIQFDHGEQLIPQEMREVCLASFDPNKRSNIRYYPDIRNFTLHNLPNRSLPIAKFIDMFRGFIDQKILDDLTEKLTNHHIAFHRNPDDWFKVYADESAFDSCMSGHREVICYAHPENDLALATLYAPGSTQVTARTIVNLKEKWYIRLFGDVLLVDKLIEQGYRKLDGPPGEFKMYGLAGEHLDLDEVILPYFDFKTTGRQILPETHNPQTGLVEVIINAGFKRTL